jgi:hypothetical protein
MVACQYKLAEDHKELKNIIDNKRLRRIKANSIFHSEISRLTKETLHKYLK